MHLPMKKEWKSYSSRKGVELRQNCFVGIFIRGIAKAINATIRFKRKDVKNGFSTRFFSVLF